MTADIDDIIGQEAKGRRGKRDTYYRRKNRGPLHHLIGRALPSICGPDGVANLHELAKTLDLTYAAVHKWMRPDAEHKIPAKQARRIVKLSEEFAENKDAPKSFKPVSEADFLPFLF